MINHLPRFSLRTRLLLWLHNHVLQDGGPWDRAETALGNGYAAYAGFLDTRVFPLVVRYTTHPIVIQCTILLLVPLIIFASATALVLLGNTYLNVASASVSSIVLMQSLKHHRANQAMHARHAEEVEKLHAKIDSLASLQTAPVPSGERTGAKAKRTVGTVTAGEPTQE